MTMASAFVSCGPCSVMSAVGGGETAATRATVARASAAHSPRRAFLQGAAAAAFLAAAGSAAPALAYDSIPGKAPGVYKAPEPLRAVPDLKELEQEVKELDYDLELFENADTADALQLRKKKERPAPEYEAEAKALAEKEEKLRATKQAAEDAQAAALKAKFSK